MTDLHKHKCPGCGHIWEHGSENRGNKEAHQCPTGCGNESWWHHEEPSDREIAHAKAAKAAADLIDRLMRS